jgi:Bacterial RNA polymerase, alpha chain C terminal domain
MALRVKYSGALNGDRPHLVDESDWRLFLAHVRDGRSLQEISRESGLSAFKVGAIISQIDRDLDIPESSPGNRNAMTADSPIENLALSMRARNALHEIGCVTAGDVLEKDFTRAVRRFGPVTRREITAVLREHGFAVPPALMDGSTSRIFELRRDLARLRDSIEDTTRRLRNHIERLEHRLNKL